MTAVTGPWARRKPLPQPLGPESRPPESLLTALRARVEQGCPFDVARRAVGVPEHVHDKWMEVGMTMHEARPDRLYHAGGCVMAGSLEPEAEYARIASTVQAQAAAKLVGQVWEIANDKGRKRDQLTAIQMLLRGMGERAFDPRTEQDVTVTATDERVGVDQSTLDAMTDDERAAIRDGARALSERRAAIESAIAAAKVRVALPPAVTPQATDDAVNPST